MSVEAGSGTDKGFLNPPVAIPREGLLRRRRLTLSPGISEARGPSACLRRDALFRRSLLIADLLSVVGAFVLTIQLSHRSVALTWFGAGGAADRGRVRPSSWASTTATKP